MLIWLGLLREGEKERTIRMRCDTFQKAYTILLGHLRSGEKIMSLISVPDKGLVKIA